MTKTVHFYSPKEKYNKHLWVFILVFLIKNESKLFKKTKETPQQNRIQKQNTKNKKNKSKTQYNKTQQN